MADKNNEYENDFNSDIDKILEYRRKTVAAQNEINRRQSAASGTPSSRMTPNNNTPIGNVRNGEIPNGRRIVNPSQPNTERQPDRQYKKASNEYNAHQYNAHQYNEYNKSGASGKKETEKSVKPDKSEKQKNVFPDKNGDIGGSLVTAMMRAIVYLVAVTVIAAVISIVVINVGNDVFAFVKSDDEIEVTIPENATTEDIADILYENGVIKYRNVFKFYGSFKHIEENYVAGDYSVTPMMNYKSLFNEFKEKPVSGTSWITIPEGYTTDEIIELMLSHEIGGTKEDYIEAINNYDYDYWFVEELEKNGYSKDRFYRLDGYLFPDTYEFYNASSATTVINKLLERFSEVYTDTYKERAEELGLTTDQVVILASMIEKEGGQSSDFRNVSSVFHNRLNAIDSFPRFESDATVVYAIQHDTGERPSKVTDETLEYKSPYNTYQNDGYPPGAIANPGMNALKYAVYPADTNYYYFVSSGDGITLFATNSAEHRENIEYVRNR